MALIKGKEKVKLVAVTVRYPEPVLSTIEQYLEFLGEQNPATRGETDRNYILVEFAKSILERDREFQRWRAARKRGDVASRAESAREPAA